MDGSAGVRSEPPSFGGSNSAAITKQTSFSNLPGAPHLIAQGWGPITILTMSLDTMQGATTRLMA